jgi:hypothetical protein
MLAGRYKWGRFQSIEERCVKRMEDWQEHLLSQVAKEVLIKATAQALSTYVMSIFKILFGLCDTLHKHTRSFWWGSGRKKHKVQ